MNRADLYKDSEDGIGLDFLSTERLNLGLQIERLENNGAVLPTYTVISTDLERPDIISVKIYGQQKWWWLLMRTNNILDPFNDLFVGQQLKVFPLDILDEFYNNAKVSVKR